MLSCASVVWLLLQAIVCVLQRITIQSTEVNNITKKNTFRNLYSFAAAHGFVLLPWAQNGPPWSMAWTGFPLWLPRRLRCQPFCKDYWGGFRWQCLVTRRAVCTLDSRSYLRGPFVAADGTIRVLELFLMLNFKSYSTLFIREDGDNTRFIIDLLNINTTRVENIYHCRLMA